ncbi:MAG: prepilin-type N-terminal cleavage/methylation domain-containing protein [Acidobacteria bacterium]|nr:prepilin-type N-terminal cleavage/methylation domain-containing protein [Acidobacteriota bacterium]
MTNKQAGFSFVELMLAVSLAGTLTAIAVPQAIQALDALRTRNAAHYLALRLADARIAAVKRSTFVGMRFEAIAADYRFSMVADGNGNGVRTADIQRGDDPVIAAPDMLAWHFEGVAFGLLSAIPDADGASSSSSDGVRVGSSGVISMNPNGSSSAGTIYVHGRGRAQYAVRVLGATGRVRVLRYDAARAVWVER